MPYTRRTAAETDAGIRLDKFLADPARLGSRGRAATALDRRKVFINDTEASVSDSARRMVPGDVVRFWEDRPAARGGGRAPERPVISTSSSRTTCCWSSTSLPGFSVPLERKADAPSIYAQIEDRFRSHGKRRPFVVHRIDQDTSGLVVFAKDPDTQRRLELRVANPSGSTSPWSTELRVQRREHGGTRSCGIRKL